jgi:glutathione S-transferase
MAARVRMADSPRPEADMETTKTAIRMYDLAGADPARRFSPFCWRIRMALAHKNLSVETIPWRYSDKPAIAHSGQDRVPVIEDGDRVIADSWAIANYLEDSYPDRPSLFGGAAARAAARFINSWADTVQNGGTATLIAADIVRHLDPRDQEYFRQSRAQRFGMTLEQLCANRDARVGAFRPSNRCE